MSSSDTLAEIIGCVARILVDYPDEVRVVECKAESITIYELHCRAEDLGKVIGKQGKNVSAMRVLLQSAATKMGKRVHLEIAQK